MEHWNAHNIETEGEKAYDPELGGDMLVRTFKILTDPEKEKDPQEVLEYHRESLLKALFKDGWKLERELMIGEATTKGVYDIIAICSPMERHGSLVGVENDNTKNLTQAIQ